MVNSGGGVFFAFMWENMCSEHPNIIKHWLVCVGTITQILCPIMHAHLSDLDILPQLPLILEIILHHVNSAIDWRPVKGIPCPSPSDSWDTLQLGGWMDGWMDDSFLISLTHYSC